MLEHGTDRSRNIGKEIPLLAAYLPITAHFSCQEGCLQLYKKVSKCKFSLTMYNALLY